jgi:mitotic spindle assembly checkpoint protein MAD2
MSTIVSNTINLKGSTEIVSEFFKYSVNTILYQRGIYPPESFKKVSQYGLAMMMTTDEQLGNYIANVTNQLEGICRVFATNLFILIYSFLQLGSLVDQFKSWC